MLNPASGDTCSGGRNDTCRSVVATLASLIEQLKAGTEVLDLAIARETAGDGQEASEDVAILDDITPCYVMVNATLDACSRALTVALQSLLDAHASNATTGGSVAFSHESLSGA